MPTSATDVRASTRLWDGAIADTYAAIVAHPFLTELTAGTLDPAAFRHYVVQDALYLADYARALALTAAKAPHEPDVATFARHAIGAIEVERELHGALLAELDIDPAALEDARPSPTTLGYTSYLLRVAHQGSFADALGVVLPCYWVYAEVGARLLEAGSPDPRYRRWIDTYGGDEFQAVVAEVLAVVDRLGAGWSDAEHARVAHHVDVSTRYEWLFWDAAHRQETWPV
ncbi:thiaminase II [Nitriliruptoraceae bacterium ZYF776]|nr:thiaminase II [Profundirhabdus halotolerans]